MWLLSCAAAAPTVLPHHDLRVVLDPSGHALAVTDALTLPPDLADGALALHAGLAPRVVTKGWELVPAELAGEFPVPVEGWRLSPTKKRAAWPVELVYGGVLDHPPVQVATEHQRSFATTPGTIGPEGVALAGGAYWVPTPVDGDLLAFTLTVDGLPDGWTAVSQGDRTAHGAGSASFTMSSPTEEVHLVAGPWTESAARYTRADGTGVDVFAFLRAPDPELARRYLDATVEDLALYEELARPYPYPSFALVENHWETGWGMPGFTLLGPQVIRFPFILTSSYPHELLHNWWGNGVYVGEGGNWCEGLTAYLADHLFAERRGDGAGYRRATLQRYTDFVGTSDDLPLSAFVGRNSAETEAVGYGKTLMVFHMVRRELGDEAFLRALRAFDDAHRFGRASWSDLEAAFAAERPEVDWAAFFDAWIDRPGAPVVAVKEARLVVEEGPALRVVLEQVQAEAPFPMTVPIALTLPGDPVAQRVDATFAPGERTTDLSLRLGDRVPTRIDVDPQFDVMRRVDPAEVPPALSNLFGEGVETFVLPASAPAEEQAAWRELAAAWAAPEAPRIVTDADPPPDGNLWLLGWTNARSRADAFAAASGQPADRADRSVVLVERDGDRVVGFVAADSPTAIPGLARKLPHYGKYSWLAFTGPEPTNSGKGSTTASSSPLSRQLGETPADAAPWPPRAALVP